MHSVAFLKSLLLACHHLIEEKQQEVQRGDEEIAKNGQLWTIGGKIFDLGMVNQKQID